MIVIGDVHGKYDLLIQLLDKLPQTDDICFVGDVIDRGGQSKEVINLIIDRGYNCVLGNHEDMATTDELLDLWLTNGGWATLRSICKGNVDMDVYNKSKELKWMQSLPLIIEYKDYLITHSYAYDGDATPIKDLLWGRSFGEDSCDKINIFGHTPNKDIWRVNGRHLCIDTGAFHTGVLTAVDLDDNEKIYQTNKE